MSVALECSYVKLSMFNKRPSSCSTSPGHGTLPSPEFKCISNFPYPVLLSHSEVTIEIHICGLLFIHFRWKPQSKILFVLALQSWHSFKGRYLRLPSALHIINNLFQVISALKSFVWIIALHVIVLKSFLPKIPSDFIFQEENNNIFFL